MRYRRDVVPGEVPDFGAIFMSNIGTKRECFQRKLFGLPSTMVNFVKHVRKGMVLFLFEFEKRELYGVFEASCDGGMNIVPNAFESSGKHFPAQVRFVHVWNCRPLAEHEFRGAIRDNYFSGKKFNYGLSEDQVYELLRLFDTKSIWKRQPMRYFFRKVDMPGWQDEGFCDDRNLVRDRVGFPIDEDGHRSGVLSKFVRDEVEEVADQVHMKGHFMRKKDNVDYHLGRGNRTVMVERTRKHNDDKFSVNDVVERGNFGNCSIRNAILGERINYSTGGSESPSFRDDVNMREMHDDVRKVSERGNKGCYFMVEKIKSEHDIEDGNGSFFTELYKKRFGEIGVRNCDGRFLMDDMIDNGEYLPSICYDEHDQELWMKGAADRSRFCLGDGAREEYHVENGLQQRVCTRHLGSPHSRGSPTMNGDGFLNHGRVESKRRTLEYPLGRPRGTNDDGMSSFNNMVKPEHDEGLGFGPVSPTAHSFRYSLGEERSAATATQFRVSDMAKNGIKVERFSGPIVPTCDLGFSFSKQSSSKFTGNCKFDAEDSYISERSEFLSMGKPYGSGLPYSRSHDGEVARSINRDPEEVSDFQHRPLSYVAAGVSSTLDNGSFYEYSKENLSTFSMNQSLPYHSQEEGAMEHLADAHGVSLQSNSHQKVSCREPSKVGPIEEFLHGNEDLKPAVRECSRRPLLPDPASLISTGAEAAENRNKGPKLNDCGSSMIAPFAYDDGHHPGSIRNYVHKEREASRTSKSFPSSDAGSCAHNEESIPRHTKIGRPPKNKRLNGSNKRESVFSRLTSVPESCTNEPEVGKDKEYDLEAAVDEVMKVLEGVNSPVKKTRESKFSARNEDENSTRPEIANKIEAHEELEPEDASQACGGGSILQETRLVDFKRRKKQKEIPNGKRRESSAWIAERKRLVEHMVAGEGLEDKVSDGFVEVQAGNASKRRKLVRPVFVKHESTEGINYSHTMLLQSSSGAFSEADTAIQEAALKSYENVDAFTNSVKLPEYDEKTATIAEPSLQDKGTRNTENHESSVKLHLDKDETEKSPEVGIIGAMTPDPSSKDRQQEQESASEAQPSYRAGGNVNAENHESSVEVFEDKDGREQLQGKDVIFAMTRDPSSENSQKWCGWIEW